MFVVGITGGIGSGKSAVTRFLEEHGIIIVDADIVAREVVEPGTPALEQIKEHFESSVISNDGSLNRKALRTIVFNKPEQRRWLESLLHPLIRQTIVQQLKTAASPYVVLASPLLLETDQHKLTDHVVVVDVPEETQIERTMQRDSNSADQVRAIIDAQISRNKRLQRANSIISNDGNLPELKEKVLELHQKLLIESKDKTDD